jgi:hypothetical protein
MPSGFELLEERLKEDRPKVENRPKFERLIFKEALNLGYNKKRVSVLPIRDAIKLCADVVASRMKWFDVDGDPNFIKKFGKFLPIDRYFELGLGDCDKYADAFIEVLELMKRDNPRLKNIYTSNSELGGLKGEHDWNGLVFVTKKGLILSHIDVSRYDGLDVLQCKRGEHLSESDFGILARFYYWFQAYEKSYELHEKAIKDIADTEARNLRTMLFIAYQMSDKARLDKVKKRYFELGAKKDLDDFYYYSYKLEKELGNHDEADRARKELNERFPDSFWTEKVLEIEKR